MVTPAARREAVAHLRLAYEVSERRACSTPGADRTSIRYRSTRPDDAAVRARLRELTAIRRRFGYRRLHILLRREGIVMNTKGYAGSIARNDCKCVVEAGASRWSSRQLPAPAKSR